MGKAASNPALETLPHKQCLRRLGRITETRQKAGKMRLTYSSSPCSVLDTQADSSCRRHLCAWCPRSWHHRGSHDGSKGPSHPCCTKQEAFWHREKEQEKEEKQTLGERRREDEEGEEEVEKGRCKKWTPGGAGRWLLYTHSEDKLIHYSEPCSESHRSIQKTPSSECNKRLEGVKIQTGFGRHGGPVFDSRQRSPCPIGAIGLTRRAINAAHPVLNKQSL